MSKKYNWKYGHVGSAIVVNEPIQYGNKEISAILEVNENNMLFVTGFLGTDSKTVFKLDINKEFCDKDIKIDVDQVIEEFLKENHFSKLKIYENLQVTFTN